MPRPRDKLTALDVKNQKKPGRDGGGLWLQVQTAERKSWLFRYSYKGKPHEMGLGPYPRVTLAEAREKAREQRALLRQGINPLAAKRGLPSNSAPVGMTFREAAKALIDGKRKGWRNAKHAAQWENTLARYAYPVIGQKPPATWRSTTCGRSSSPSGRPSTRRPRACAGGWKTCSRTPR